VPLLSPRKSRQGCPRRLSPLRWVCRTEVDEESKAVPKFQNPFARKMVFPSFGRFVRRRRAINRLSADATVRSDDPANSRRQRRHRLSGEAAGSFEMVDRRRRSLLRGRIKVSLQCDGMRTVSANPSHNFRLRYNRTLPTAEGERGSYSCERTMFEQYKK
jgi:hypothetical protein